MFFKPYQKLLSVGCLALYLVGCGGDSSEPLVEVEKNFFNSTIEIISKANNIEIQDLKLNRGNCEHDKNVLLKLMQETANAYLFVSEKEKAIKNHQAKIARLQKDLEELTQYVQQFNNLDKLLAFFYEFKSRIISPKLGITSERMVWLSKEEYNKYNKKIFATIKKALDSHKYESDIISPELFNILLTFLISTSEAIENTKNPKDYPYINLKELKKLIDSISDSNSNTFDGDNVHVSKKGLQSLAKLKSMWPSVEKFYLAYLKEAILRNAKEVADKLIASEEESIKANQVKLTEATQNIDKMEKIIKDLESKKSTMAVDLKFGETFTADYECQNLIEVKVKTNKGAWTFNF